jgi:hypothetical protein
MKKVTIESILKKKSILKEIKTEPFYSKFFDGEIEIENISPSKILEIVQNANPDEPLRADHELIYACCPVFRSKELLEEYEVQDPIDIISKIYGNNIIEPSELAKHILKRYGFYLGEGVETIKK